MIVNLANKGKKPNLLNIDYTLKGKSLSELIDEVLKKHAPRCKNISFSLTAEETQAMKMLLKPIIGAAECDVVYRHLKALLPSYTGLEISCGYLAKGGKSADRFQQPLIIEYSEAA